MRVVARVVPAATVACVIATAYLGVTAAGAQQPAVAVGNYGGGAVLASPGSIYAQGNMLIGLRASGGVVRMNVSMALRISSDGERLARALYDVTVRCDGATITDAFDAPRRDLTISADGSVSDTERFTLRRRGEVYRSVERFSATIGSGGARGTFSTSTRVSDRRTGRTLRRCRSGTVRWTAAR